MRPGYFVLFAVVLLIAGGGWFYVRSHGATVTEVTTVTSPYTYRNASSDLIMAEDPEAGTVVGKAFSVSGSARGYWYFEASFPVEVLDRSGNVIATAVAEAQSDWMTEEWVPFMADLKVPDSYIGPATIILRKDNPSGLPEHEASLSYPVVIEY